MLTLMVSAVLVSGGALLGFGTARRFVRDRLRFVDRAHQPKTAILAGLATAVVALPVAGLLSLLPLVHLGGGAILAMGLSVGLGVRAGSKDARPVERQLRD